MSAPITPAPSIGHNSVNLLQSIANLVTQLTAVPAAVSAAKAALLDLETFLAANL